jgi:hypothetical protein
VWLGGNQDEQRSRNSQLNSVLQGISVGKGERFAPDCVPRHTVFPWPAFSDQLYPYIVSGDIADHGGAVESVAFIEAAVEVAEAGVGQGDSVALKAIGLDVAAEIDLHIVLLEVVPPPGGVALSGCGRASYDF